MHQQRGPLRRAAGRATTAPPCARAEPVPGQKRGRRQPAMLAGSLREQASRLEGRAASFRVEKRTANAFGLSVAKLFFLGRWDNSLVVEFALRVGESQVRFLVIPPLFGVLASDVPRRQALASDRPPAAPRFQSRPPRAWEGAGAVAHHTAMPVRCAGPALPPTATSCRPRMPPPLCALVFGRAGRGECFLGFCETKGARSATDARRYKAARQGCSPSAHCSTGLR